MPKVEPRILKGFRDLDPRAALQKSEMLDKIRDVFFRYGYPPIETPALEYSDVLLGGVTDDSGGSDEAAKQLFRFNDQGGRDVSLRFDLTVPLARFAAMHVQELGIPFRRHHIASVWRAEKPQKGRYREFTQCDFDIIGVKQGLADTEILTLVCDIFAELGIDVTVRVNHRQLLNGLLHQVGAEDRFAAVLRVIDKLDKLGRSVVEEELNREAGLESSQIATIFDFLAISQQGSDLEKQLSDVSSFLGESTREIAENFKTMVLNANRAALKLDLSIARGLGYYTGTVFETQCIDLPQIGSICSGGRYDDLASLFTKRQLPGVGGSVGLDRTLAALEELNVISSRMTCADVLICPIEESAISFALQVASQVRDQEISAELFPECQKIGNQLSYASKKGISLAVMIGSKEVSSQTCSIKDLRNGNQSNDVALSDVVSKLRELLRA